MYFCIIHKIPKIWLLNKLIPHKTTSCYSWSVVSYKNNIDKATRLILVCIREGHTQKLLRVFSGSEYWADTFLCQFLKWASAHKLYSYTLSSLTKPPSTTLHYTVATSSFCCTQVHNTHDNLFVQGKKVLKIAVHFEHGNQWLIIDNIDFQ